MRRRALIFGGIVAARWASPGAAQQARRPVRIAVLLPSTIRNLDGPARADAFVKALVDLGWVEGRTLNVETHWLGDNPERLRQDARQVVAGRPDLILAATNPLVIACIAETRTLPIVFVSVTDPVGAGIVGNLASSGRNITGFTNFDFALGAKWVAVMRSMVPGVRRAAVLYNPGTAPYGPSFLKLVETAGRAVGIDVSELATDQAGELAAKLKALADTQDAMLFVTPDVFTTANRDDITRLANENGLPSIYPFRFFALAGGLISYGFDRIEPYRRAGLYAHRILRGDDPAALPIQNPTHLEMVINLKTARLLGIEVPPTLLAEANEVVA